MGKLMTNVITLFKNLALEASGSDSIIVDMNQFKPAKDNVTFQLHLAGASSTVTVAVTVSHTRSGTYSAVSSKTEVVANQTPGDAVIDFTGPVAPFWKVTVTETSGSNAVTDFDLSMAVR